MCWQAGSLVGLTREYCWHERGEHEEEHAEEEAAGVVVRLRRLVADAQVEQADENADREVRDETEPRESLQHTKNTTVV